MIEGPKIERMESYREPENWGEYRRLVLEQLRETRDALGDVRRDLKNIETRIAVFESVVPRLVVQETKTNQLTNDLTKLETRVSMYAMLIATIISIAVTIGSRFIN